MEKVIVTPRSLSKGSEPQLDRIREAGYELVFPSPGVQPSADQLNAVIGDAVGYLAGVEKIDAAVLSRAKKLKVISRNGTGVDNIDLAKAEELGITICRAEGANARGVAEFAFGLILAAVRGIPAASALIRNGGWAREKGFELEGKVLGLVGCGKIGRLVAQFALAFGMKVAAYDPYPDAAFTPSPDFAFTDLDSVFRTADVITFHCPPVAGGKPLLDSRALESVKPGVIVVNTARESLVENAAMVAALDSGRVRTYAIDAFDKEPPEDRAIADHSNVIATPHIGGFTVESVERATAVAIDNLLKTLEQSGV